MGVLIDSSVLIEAERGRLDLAAHVENHTDDEFFVSVVTASELLHGVHRANDPAVRARRSAFVEAVLERLPLLPVDLTTARAHARIWAQLARSGTTIGQNDIWLAASCVAHGLTMVTSNVADFERVPGLDVEVWLDIEIA